MQSDMLHLPFTPEGEISPFVETIYYLKDYIPDHSVERLVPDGSVNLIIELDGQERFIYDNESFEIIQKCTHSWLSGMHDRYISISSLKNTELMLVRFYPGGIFPFLGRSVYELRNRVVDARDIFGEQIASLRSDIMNVGEPEEKVRLTDRWLHDRFNSENTPTPVILRSCRQIMERPNIRHIKGIVEKSGYSDKQFILLFKKEIGLTPKVFQRILKFNQILPLLQDRKKIKWTEISQECGYFDQPHFIRDFKRFSGFNPSDFIDNSFDRLNFFPVK